MKVAGFSEDGVMVSTTGSDPVDRGSTPFLPTSINNVHLLFGIVFLVAPSVCEDRWSFLTSQRGVSGCIVLS